MTVVILLGGLLVVAVVAAAGALAWHVSRHRGLLSGVRPVMVWLLETALVALVLFLLWHPAITNYCGAQVGRIDSKVED